MTQQPFGMFFSEAVPDAEVELPYDVQAQTTAITDAELSVLAASDNTLTFTAGKDNDFDE